LVYCVAQVPTKTSRESTRLWQRPAGIFPDHSKRLCLCSTDAFPASCNLQLPMHQHPGFQTLGILKCWISLVTLLPARHGQFLFSPVISVMTGLTSRTGSTEFPGCGRQSGQSSPEG
ncbi:hypothetical protein CLAIMM_07192 isoform 1, partial [Cladophialophora immunda]